MTKLPTNLVGVVCIFAVCLVSWPSLASALCANPIAEIVSAQGNLELNKAPAKLADVICPGDVVKVGPRSRAAIVILETDTVLRIDQDTELRMRSVSPEGVSLLDLLRGAINLLTPAPRSLEIKTPVVNAAVEGTEFYMRVEADRTVISVFEGRVTASNDFGSLTLHSGQSAVARAGKAPEPRIVVRPRDAVQWSLHYPTIGVSEKVSPMTREATDLLIVGRVDEATTLLDQARKENPNDAVAVALQAVIAVAQNRSEEATQLAQQAVAIDQGSSTAYTALSYVQQSQFNIDGALESALQAVKRDPNNAYALARLAELQSSKGDLRASLESARQAVAIDPTISRTQTVLGFIHLTRIETAKAKEAFNKAIALNSEDPLPRLGLGLATIRNGDLGGGRRDIEIAAALDPNSSLIRSYLGKAYFEEKRDSLDGKQYAIAKQLDPRDPTPWLYDAIRKQTINRPVEALRDLQTSIELNDNRAVYRSRLLLDGDLASRGTSLARVYDTLGFERLGLIEASKSLALDPSNHSAHRFLSDTFAAIPRHEVARASELLQSQMLQPLNLYPVQPALVETDLNVISGAGPAQVAFNEFTPLFVTDRPRLLLTGVGGNNGTFGDEVVVNGIQDKFAYSVGQYHYETDGLRENNDLEHDIYNVFAQVAMTPFANLQFEYRNRKSDRGDVSLNFDPDDFSPLDRLTIESETPRLGLRLSPSSSSELLLSWIHTERDEASIQFLGSPGPNVDVDLSSEADNYEAQYLLRRDRWNLVVGLGTAEIDRTEISIFDASADFPGGICPPGPPFFGDCILIDKINDPVEQDNAYVYSNVTTSDELRWTFGLSYERFESAPLDVDEVNPKIGVQWDLTQNATLRAAYFENLRTTLLTKQTIEPTQVAGFNQLFDDFDGTESESAGIGIDWEVNKRLFVGVEYLRRDLRLPQRGSEGGVVEEEQKEEMLRAYAYATLGNNWAVTGEMLLEDFEREDPLVVDPLRQVDTLIAPLTVRYFSPSGLFAGVRASYIDQDIRNVLPFATQTGDDNAVILDVAVGYRLPKRRGVLSLEVRNVFDEEFRFQDQNIQSAVPSNPRFVPDTSAVVRVTLSF